MEDGAEKKERKARSKRRVPGSDTPPRQSMVLRLEKSTWDRMNAMLDRFNTERSRNEYIERLIVVDLDYRERLQPLNTPVDRDPST